MIKLPDTVIKNNLNLKIETPYGFESFYGINKIKKDRYIHLKFTNGKELKCSLDHPLSTIEGIIKAKDLDIYTEVYTKDGGCFLVESEIVEEPIELYDIVNSGIKHLYYSNDIVSHNCEFLGSVDTLIAPSKLRSMVYDHPKKQSGGLDVYIDPQKEHDYLITVDVARGVSEDYSAFVVVDITEFPHKVVAKYRNNEIKPMLFPNIIYEVAKNYNGAYILCEVNDIGDQVASLLHYDLEYQNVLMCSMRGRAGQIVGQGFSGKKTQLGVKMSKTVKKVGSLNLKTMIEEDKLIFNDYEIISELTTFIQKHNSFEAEEGCNDDLAMCIHRTAKIVTEDGIKTIKWIVDNKYTGKVLSIDKNNNFVWSNVIGHSSKPNKNKKWIGIRGKSKNTLICTTDHKVAYIDDIFNPIIKYTEAENMLGKYNIILPGQRFHKTNPLFNSQQVSALVGTLIGDSSISKNGKFVCAHGKFQEKYAKHKSILFNSKLRIQNRNGKINYWIDGLTNEHTRFFRQQLYPNGIKTIKNILNFVDEISLAYWYMDDGSRRGNSLVLCTDSFTYEEHELIVDMLKTKFNIDANITKIFNTNPKTKKKTEAFRISISASNSGNFFDIISPYVIESMRYKLPEKYHKVEVKKLDNKCLDFGSEKITKIMDRSSKGFESRLYDITVENTHNFIANGMVVHNCLVIYAWLVAQDYFKELTDQDIRKRLYEEQKNQIEQDMAPFGFISDGLDSNTFVDVDGDRWFTDEYGDMSSEWEYMWKY